MKKAYQLATDEKKRFCEQNNKAMIINPVLKGSKEIDCNYLYSKWGSTSASLEGT